MNIFSKLCTTHNCDKYNRHRYDLVYHTDWKDKRQEKLKILEVGIFKGNSIKVWLDYFPNAQIYAIDIFERIDENDVEILQDKRVTYKKGDSRTININDWGDDFDLIIDDGLHFIESNLLTFYNLSPFLKKHGVYYIEDIIPIDGKEVNHPWVKLHKDQYSNDKWDKLLRVIKDKGGELIDNRKITKSIDSVIAKIKI